MKTKIVEHGDEKSILIPDKLVKFFGFNVNEELEISIKDNEISIKRREPEHKSIEDLFKDFKSEYIPIEIDWGEARGNEIW